MIELVNVSKTYKKGNKKALNDINLQVRDGEIFGFLGPNGAGKTTAIKVITGILRQDTGRVFVNGVDMLNEPVKAKSSLGFVPDNPEIFNRLTGLEYLNFIADVFDMDEKQRMSVVIDLAEQFEMKDVLSSRIESFSHGMKQKLAVMGALIHDPEVWVLDEPMVGLDPKAAYTLKNMMRKHADTGNTVFFSTHIMEVAEKLCDRIGIIKGGKIIFTGTVDELRMLRKDGVDSLENLFLEMIEK